MAADGRKGSCLRPKPNFTQCKSLVFCPLWRSRWRCRLAAAPKRNSTSARKPRAWISVTLFRHDLSRPARTCPQRVWWVKPSSRPTQPRARIGSAAHPPIPGHSKMEAVAVSMDIPWWPSLLLRCLQHRAFMLQRFYCSSAEMLTVRASRVHPPATLLRSASVKTDPAATPLDGRRTFKAPAP